jgi:sorbitol-specific phosphotransferase system component IIBC
VTRFSSGWPEVSIAICGVLMAIFAYDLAFPGRIVLAVAFVTVLPGAALVRLFSLTDVVANVIAAIAVSLALALLVATVCTLAFTLSPTIVMLVLVAVTLVGNIVEVTATGERSQGKLSG